MNGHRIQSSVIRHRNQNAFDMQADGQAAPGHEDFSAAAEDINPERLQAAIQCSSAPAAEDTLDQAAAAGSRTAPTTVSL